MKLGSVYGAEYSPSSTVFRLWSPQAVTVFLRLYAYGSKEEAPAYFLILPMSMDQDGVWSTVYEGDAHGLYYDYHLSFQDGHTVESADPWAKACGVNGSRSMVVDLARTDPEGWSEDKHLSTAAAAPVVWEVHVKDFSSDPHSGIPEELRGKFLAFTKDHTTLDNDGIHPTCVAYLKKLGVTHVQLLPIADYFTVDERTCTDYNWGYDIENYNVPEGSYATDPFHGEVRIRECKQMIQALHKAGIGVILDVVYNHTYHKHSWLERTAPGHYYRYAEDGSFLNASGCGCETASEHLPFRNYMLQSVLYWAKEYHVDGFRFDLMGIHDVDTMNLIREELDKLPNGASILTYGEPWSALPTGIKPPDRPANKGSLMLLNERVGAFSDGTRNLIAGNVYHPEDGGYVSGHVPGWMVNQLRSALTGWCRTDLDQCVKAPNQVVQYVSCHDNHVLWDRLVLGHGHKSFDAIRPELEQKQKLISGLYLTCLGIAFMRGGEEFTHTKHGLHNTYNGPLTENCLHWQKTVQHNDLIEWYKGMIILRKLMICSLSAEAAQAVKFEMIEAPSVAMSFPAAHTTLWDTFLTAYNPTDRAQTLALPEGEWQLLCDGVSSRLMNEPACYSWRECGLPAHSVIILARLKKASEHPSKDN